MVQSKAIITRCAIYHEDEYRRRQMYDTEMRPREISAARLNVATLIVTSGLYDGI